MTKQGSSQGPPNDPGEEADPVDGSGFRIVQRTYSDDAAPLVEVLVMLYDWSIERQLRVRAALMSDE